MNICHFIDGFSSAYGGGSHFTLNLTEHLSKLGHKSVIVTRQWKDKHHDSFPALRMPPAIKSINQSRHPANLLNFSIQNMRLTRFFLSKSANFDVLNIHGETVPLFPHIQVPKLMVYHPWMAAKKPVCLTVHALWSLFTNETYTKESEKKMFEKAKHIVVVERFMADLLEREFGVSSNKVSYLPAGIEFVNFKEPSPLSESLARKRVVFSAIRLSKERNPDFLISAMQLIPKSENIVLLIAGSGPMKSQLEELIHRFDLSEKIKLMGNIENREVLSLIRSCDVIINPSTVPGASRIVMEAFANGKPAIRPRLTDVYPVIDGKTGVLYDPNDAEDLANKLQMLASDPKLAREMGERGKALAENEYDINRIANEYSKIYEHLIA